MIIRYVQADEAKELSTVLIARTTRSISDQIRYLPDMRVIQTLPSSLIILTL
jgi:hypothetical protein